MQYIENKGISKYKFYQDTGITRGVLDKESGISEENIAKFIAYAPEVSLNWLLKNEGEIIETKNEKKVINLNDNQNDNLFDAKRKIEEKLSIVSELQPEYGKIPLYDGVVIAGQKSVADLSPQTMPVGYINAGDWFKDATGAMQVYDDSMTEYPTGSYVCFRQIQDRQLIIYGQDYVIETKEYRVIKKIQRSDKEGYILLASTNQDLWENGPLAGRMIHEPFEVFMDSIINICRVLGAVNRKESVYLYK